MSRNTENLNAIEAKLSQKRCAAIVRKVIADNNRMYETWLAQTAATIKHNWETGHRYSDDH